MFDSVFGRGLYGFAKAKTQIKTDYFYSVFGRGLYGFAKAKTQIKNGFIILMRVKR
jgi:hypothetical protein